jgi:hypothetical protein
MPYSPCCTPFLILPRPDFAHLERVVLWCNLLDEEVSEHRNLLHNVVANLGYLGEEEEGEEASDTTEAASKGTARLGVRFFDMVGVGSERIVDCRRRTI